MVSITEELKYMRHLCIVGLVISLSIQLTYSAYASPFTPLKWQQRVEKHEIKSVVGQRKHINWVRDRDCNFIDDKIDIRHGTEELLDVIIDLNCFLPPKKIQDLFGEVGTVRYVGKLITFVLLDDVKYKYLKRIADMPEVAMIEIQEDVHVTTDVSARAIQSKASATYSPSTIEDVNLPDKEIIIAILDTGVDDDHEQLKGKFAGGFNALIFEDTNMNGMDDSCEPAPLGNGVCTDSDDEPADSTRNPDDDCGHGTLVAGIALGQGAPNRTCRTPDDGSTPNNCAGIAPKARLVDIKTCHCGDCPAPDVAEALDWLGLNYEMLGVRVANISFASCTNDDGTSAMSQQVNYLVALGIVMISAHGNSTNCYPPTQPGDKLTSYPGSASFAVTVAGTNDKGTVDRTDDNHYVGYLIGPRSDFNLSSPNLLALKPDISAPGQAIFSAKYNSIGQYICDSGTSLAAPHVAGAAALILQSRSTMDPGSVKDLLRYSSETSQSPEYPSVDPKWDAVFGSGMLNVWTALENSPATDVGFPSCSGPPDIPGKPCTLSGGVPYWLNTVDIDTLAPPQVGVANSILANVQNSGTADATVLVNFGVYIFGVGNNQFFHIGTQQRTISAGSTVPVSQPWIPSESNHQCIQVSIGYGLDTDFDNNVTQRNLQVAPSVYTIRVENPFAVPAVFEVKPRSLRDGWVCRVKNPKFALHPYRDQAKNVQITFDPPKDAKEGQRANCNIYVLARPVDKEKDVLIGGVTVQTFVPKPCRIIGWIRDKVGHPVRRAKVILETERQAIEAQSDKNGFVSFEATPYRLQSIIVITGKYGKQRAKVRLYCGVGTFEILVTEKGLTIHSHQREKDWAWDLQLRKGYKPKLVGR